MEFQHDASWAALTSILESRLTAKESWSRLIDFHEQSVSKEYWQLLRDLDIDAEQKDFVSWFGLLVRENPLPETVMALWIGILKFAGEGKEIPTIYLAGSEYFDKEDIDWVCEPAYLPVNKYAQPEVLSQIDAIAKTDEDNYGFIDWIFPLAYCAFMIDEIMRTKLDKGSFLGSVVKLHVAVGHDGGDFIVLSDVARED